MCGLCRMFGGADDWTDRLETEGLAWAAERRRVEVANVVLEPLRIGNTNALFAQPNGSP